MGATPSPVLVGFYEQIHRPVPRTAVLLGLGPTRWWSAFIGLRGRETTPQQMLLSPGLWTFVRPQGSGQIRRIGRYASFHEGILPPH